MEKLGLLARVAKRASDEMGRPWAFALAALTVVIWVSSGPLFGFDETWQLIINTVTSVVTFMMVFLMQTAQNRDTQAIQLKLDELIRATNGAHNHLIALEGQSEGNVLTVRQELEHEAAQTPAAASRSE